MTPPSNVRNHLVDCLSLLANVSAQATYEKEVQFVPVHVELIETFYDLYIPNDHAFVAAFTKEEAMRLAELAALLDTAAKKSETIGIHSVSQLQELPEWHLVIRQAQIVHEVLRPKS
jgi:hypothetical protein